MNEIVKYHNHMNTVGMRNFKSTELDLFLSLCQILKNSESKKITLSFNKLREIIKYSSTDKKDFLKVVEDTYTKMLHLDFRFENEDEIVKFILFNFYKIDKKNETVEVSVNEEFKWVLNELSNNFTRFELEEFIGIRSSYAKELYRRLKQYRHTGYWMVSIEDFRYFLDIPKSYKMINIDKKVLEISFRQLEPHFKNLNLQKIKYGTKISHLVFTFDKEIEYITQQQLKLGKETQKPYGTYFNVYLSDKEYEELKEVALDEKTLQNAINRLSGAIKKNKDKKYNNYVYLIKHTLKTQNKGDDRLSRMEKGYENIEEDDIEIDLSEIMKI